MIWRGSYEKQLRVRVLDYRLHLGKRIPARIIPAVSNHHQYPMNGSSHLARGSMPSGGRRKARYLRGGSPLPERPRPSSRRLKLVCRSCVDISQVGKIE